METTEVTMEATTTVGYNYTPPSEGVFKHPTMAEYYGNLTPFLILSMFTSALICLLNVSIFHTTVMQLRQRLPKPLLRISIALCSPYVIISFAAFITILVPKSWFICHTVMHLSFTVCAVLLYRLCLHYVDSEANFIKENDGKEFTLRTPPCCCCCMCLPSVSPTKAKFSFLRYLVWQMPFVQGSVMLVLNVIYYFEADLYSMVSQYFIPFIVCSIIFGLWGLNITVRLVNSVHADYGTMIKMFCLQLILLLCKLQYMLLNSQLDGILMGGPYPINHTIYKQTFINLLISVEMILVSLLVQHAYKSPVLLSKE